MTKKFRAELATLIAKHGVSKRFGILNTILADHVVEELKLFAWTQERIKEEEK